MQHSIVATSQPGPSWYLLSAVLLLPALLRVAKCVCSVTVCIDLNCKMCVQCDTAASVVVASELFQMQA